MTLKQEQIYGAMVYMAQRLKKHNELYGEAMPFCAFGRSRVSYELTALGKMKKQGIVEAHPVKNFDGHGARPGYKITERGIAWLEEAERVYKSTVNLKPNR